MGVGRIKEEWLTNEEVEKFFDYHIERAGDRLNPCSDILNVICNAMDVREYLRHCKKDIYQIVKNWDDCLLNDWYIDLGDEYMHDIQSKNNLWMLDNKYGLASSEARMNLAWEIDIEDYRHDDLFVILANYLSSAGIKNNISDYADVLSSDGFYTILNHIKIENKRIFSVNADKEVRKSLFDEYGQIFSFFRNDFYDINHSCKTGMSNKKFSYLMDRLNQRGFIRDDWQSVIANRRIAKTNTGKYITRRDLNEALRSAKETADCIIYGKKNEKQLEYEEIKRFVESL